MLITQKRPRDLSWLHAGPLLYGDWGTSRLYVLGLAFFFAAHATPYYLLAMSVLMAGVAWAYTVICRCFPEGGGVYTAARQIHPILSLVGATLLLAGYVITAAISVVVGFRYFGLPTGSLLVGLSIFTIGLLGIVNWFGAKSAGMLAMLVALLALIVSVVIAASCAPLISDGFSNIAKAPSLPAWDQWTSFVNIVLALSGVEAVANMTGLMKEPVARTSKKTIWPVLIEVVVLNLIFGLALNGLASLAHTGAPDAITYVAGEVPEHVLEYRDTAMRTLAEATTGPTFALVAAIVFGLLLFSAANTAIVAMISVLYSMAQDQELPRPLTKLNYSGVPWVALLVSCIVPAIVLLIERDVDSLADLYAVGVCGAVTINIASCVANRSLPIRVWERSVLSIFGLIMALVAITIILTKANAAIFAAVMVLGVLGIRQALVFRRRAAARVEPIPEPTTGWLQEVEKTPINLDPTRPRIMLAARGRYQAEFAVDLARRRKGTLFVIFVRTLRVLDLPPGHIPHVKDDPDALESLGSAAVLAQRYGIPLVPIYVTSTDIVGEILDYTVTYGCDTLILGKSRRKWFSRAVSGDVVAEVARQLPEGVSLITREAAPHAMHELDAADPDGRHRR